MGRKTVFSVLSVVLMCFAICGYSAASPNVNDNEIAAEIINLQIYYEALCPDCMEEYPELPPLIEKLGDHVDLHTYPYGNAKMTKRKNGKVIVKCQHGEAECYGNKLHACAIDQLKEQKAYVDFNACLMAKESDDDAADACGQSQGVDSNSIKTCARGARGFQLLVYYGEESQKVNYSGVPYVLVNGNPKPDEQSLWDAVCKAFSDDQRPEVCRK